MPLKCTNALFDIVDTNGNGRIDFSEFKASAMSSQVYLNESCLRKAFNFFDKNKNGSIEWFELKAVFENMDDVVNIFDDNDF